MANSSKGGNTPFKAIILKGCWQNVLIRNYSQPLRCLSPIFLICNGYLKYKVLEVDIVDNQNKKIITKENLIGIILDKCEDDYISTEDLLVLIDKASDEDGIISKKKLIKSIKSSHTKSIVKNIYNILEETIFESLSSVDKKHDVHIKMFEGVSLDGKFIPEKIKKNNLTGELGLVHSYIKPKFNITRSYREKLNDK